MPKVTVNFTRCVQDSQEYGSTDDHMVSRVFFTIETEGRSVPCYADLKQTVGSDYLKGDIEVAPPKTQKDEKPYRGPFNHEAFREQATARSEEHTSELQSPCNLVCRLLLEKKKKKKI